MKALLRSPTATSLWDLIVAVAMGGNLAIVFDLTGYQAAAVIFAMVVVYSRLGTLQFAMMLASETRTVSVRPGGFVTKADAQRGILDALSEAGRATPAQMAARRAFLAEVLERNEPASEADVEAMLREWPR